MKARVEHDAAAERLHRDHEGCQWNLGFAEHGHMPLSFQRDKHRIDDIDDFGIDPVDDVILQSRLRIGLTCSPIQLRRQLGLGDRESLQLLTRIIDLIFNVIQGPNLVPHSE